MQTTTLGKETGKAAKRSKKKIEAGFNTLEDGLTKAIEASGDAVFPSGFSLRTYARQHPLRIGIALGAVGLLAVGLVRARPKFP